ncbi:MAG: cytochrome c oxidase assembly protein [Solirubrobacterales bacterium]|nr:cytochrome c oxidase assembly protein [Solirubrobacterales bacterium]
MDLGGWTIQAALVYVVAAALLYYLGGRRWRKREPLRAAAFVAGLITIVLALDGPIDTYADQLFWVHMLQHVLLLTLAPPLILLGRPWPRMWRALPLRTRATVGRTIARARWAAPLRALARPLPAWVLFNATMVLWHIPAAYNATLSNQTIHNVEHAMFFFTGLLFWARVIDPGPLRPRLQWPARVAYAVGAMVVGWILAITLVLVPHPLYSHYADLATRPGGISALTDQQLAGGVMWVLGSISFTITMLIGFYRWLEPEKYPPPSPVRASGPLPSPAGAPGPDSVPHPTPVLTP